MLLNFINYEIGCMNYLIKKAKDNEETEKFLLKCYKIKGPTFMSLKLKKN
jgi:hypothetical protein